MTYHKSIISYTPAFSKSKKCNCLVFTAIFIFYNLCHKYCEITHRSGQVAGQVAGQVTGQVTGQVAGQVNRKNIFLPRKLTIVYSKLTRYEKESVMMRGIVYFKLQDVALRN